ncbi:MAG: hypothetical protein ABIH22_01785 [Candidatus Margulisiibacteriota bacterium]
MLKTIWNSFKAVVLLILQLQFYIYVVGCLLMTLFNPYFQNSEWIITAPYLLALQFLLIHSGGFMGMFFIDKGEKDKRAFVGAWVVLLIFYSIFALALFIPSNNLHLLGAFFSYMFSRFVNQIVFSQKEFSKSLLVEAGVGTAFLLLWVAIIFISTPPLPRFEIIQTVISELSMKHKLEPNTILSFYWTICYFTSMGLFELYYTLSLDKKIKSAFK